MKKVQFRWIALLLAGFLLSTVGLLQANAKKAAKTTKTTTSSNDLSALLPPLSAKHQRVLFASKGDPPKIQISHHFKSNENRHDLFKPYIKGIRGAHLGVASDQNYTIMAWAKSEFGWVIDFDAVIQYIHLSHRAFALAAPTGKEFLTYWGDGKKGLAKLKDTYIDHKEKKTIFKYYKRYRKGMTKYLSGYFKPANLWRKTWLATPEHYRYIRKMFQENRIRILYGNLYGTSAMRGIGAAAKKAGLTIRSVYLSNAEEWVGYNHNFRQNFISLPFDKKTVLLRTMWRKEFQPRSSDFWQYNVHNGLHYQNFMKTRHKGYRWIGSFNRMMRPSPKWGLTLTGFPFRRF
jgi:hypothetical protein